MGIQMCAAVPSKTPGVLCLHGLSGVVNLSVKPQVKPGIVVCALILAQRR